MVDPFLDGALHLHLHQPVDIVGRGVVIRRTANEVVNLLLRVFLLGVDAVDLHPLDELPVIDDVFLERVAHLVNEVDVSLGIVGVDLAAAFIHRHEHRLDTARGLRHQRSSAGRRDGQTGDVAAAVFHHVGVELRIGLLDAQDERIVLLALGVVDGESAALSSHVDAAAIGVEGQSLLHLNGKVG